MAFQNVVKFLKIMFRDILKRDVMIHCIGDSHCYFFYGSDEYDEGLVGSFDSLLPYFKIHHIGSSLAYNLCSEGTTTGGREKILGLLDNHIPAGSRVMLCFGEIDCRYHIPKQAGLQNKDVKIIIEECVNRYVGFIKEIKAKGFDVLVWGVIPSPIDSAKADPFFPRWGTCQERNSVTRCFNEKLESMLNGESIKFVSLFDQLVGVGNLTKGQHYLADKIHLAQTMMPAAIKELRGNLKILDKEYLK